MKCIKCDFTAIMILILILIIIIYEWMLDLNLCFKVNQMKSY